ncbi:unnamed protein product [Schistocephalus solidus]|uniref:Retrotransposon protein, putative, unclassified n=1 Tax=Schistocephalus solidus TaxID=70667 RepID=A0A183T0Y4_SCHSO|nr:unnamed protein product [Schistocephalus solidus]
MLSIEKEACLRERNLLQELCPAHDLFLKPVCKVNITVQLPGFQLGNSQGKSLSTWEVADKLRQLSTVEFVRFVVELGLLGRFSCTGISVFLSFQRIKLSGFPQALRVRATEAQTDCPRRHDWDAFFRDAKDMDETKYGERPDTVVVDNLPVRWFAADVPRSTSSAFGSVSKSSWPSAHILKEVFEVDFDRTKHLSDDWVERRDVARLRLEEWIQRRRAAAEVAEAKRQKLAREAEELAAKRKQEAEAERQASRLAREQRRRLKVSI